MLASAPVGWLGMVRDTTISSHSPQNALSTWTSANGTGEYPLLIMATFLSHPKDRRRTSRG
jgi:hypothetical protein